MRKGKIIGLLLTSIRYLIGQPIKETAEVLSLPLDEQIEDLAHRIDDKINHLIRGMTYHFNYQIYKNIATSWQVQGQEKAS